jgi:hypothetical protein
MEPFRIAKPLKHLIEPYPRLEEVLDAVLYGGEPALKSLARLWLSEGIPYAFRECPAIYESVRSWLGNWIGVHPKEISLTGSSRLGISLAPSKLGKPLTQNSDLDLFTVSDSLFEDLKEEFRKWSFDFESGKLKPRNDREAGFWANNNARGPQLLDRGFIDQKMIPNLEWYPITQRLSQGMWLVVNKLKLTYCAPQPSIASLRCYKTWNSFIRQTMLNLSTLKESI